MNRSSADERTRRFGLRALLGLAWPAIASYLLSSAYRINDQFWIQGLGQAAQAAIGAAMFVVIMNFSVAFIAAGGTLSLVARGVGANDLERADRYSRSALVLGTLIGLVTTIIGPFVTPLIVRLLGLDGQTAVEANAYLSTLYLCSIPLFLTPVLDHILIGRGDTRLPLVLQGLAIALNFALNPILIYGTRAAEVLPDGPFVGIASSLTDTFAPNFGGWGMEGAAWATGISRGIVLLIGLAALWLRHGTIIAHRDGFTPRRMIEIARVSMPVSISIGMYAGVYWVMFGLVLSKLGDPVRAGLGIGFQVFEGVAYPCFLGVSVAVASLVGQALGAGDRDGALLAVSSARRAARVLGLIATAAFLLGARPLGALFTEVPAVLDEVVLYVWVLAFSQYSVAMETINERVLLGAGRTRSIPWIAGVGNVLRIPLAWVLSLPLGWGALGVWIAINVTSYAKSFLFWRQVQRGDWLESAEVGTSMRAADDGAIVTEG